MKHNEPNEWQGPGLESGFLGSGPQDYGTSGRQDDRTTRFAGFGGNGLLRFGCSHKTTFTAYTQMNICILATTPTTSRRQWKFSP